MVSNETTPTSPLGAASGPNPITVDRWVPRLHPCGSEAPAYWMELGAIGRGGPPIATSPLGAASGPNPITVDRWVPRLHPCGSEAPAYWMELGAIGRGGPPIGMAGEPSETLTVSVGLVTLSDTRRFPLSHSRKPQEHIVFAQVATHDIGA